MRTRRIARYSSNPSEQGSTLLEVIVALLVLSVLGAGAWNSAAASLRSAARLREKMLFSVHLLQLDDRLREIVGRVRAPFWASDNQVSAEAGTLTAAYLDGDSKKSLSLSFQDGALSIGDGERTMLFTDFIRADFSPAADEGNRVYGVSVDLEGKNGERHSLVARFGGHPIGSASAP